MLRLYNPSGQRIGAIEHYQNLCVEEEISQLNVISFEVPKSESDLIDYEGYVETENDGRYVIKEKSSSNDTMEIKGIYDLEELSGFIESKAYVSLTLSDMMKDILVGTGWDFQTSDTSIKTASGVTIDRLDLIYAIVRDTFGLEIKFDNRAKVITAEHHLGSDKGVYFHDEVNLVEVKVDGDTYDFATRIIPRGADGLSIESVNGGLPYLENLQYSSKIITTYWSDERYTVPERLMAAAQDKLDILSKPLKSYAAQVVDLSRVSKMTILEYSPGDVITLQDRESGIREKQRIVLRKKYLDEPERDSVTIANRLRQIDDEIRSEFDGLRQNFTVIRASLQLLDEAVEGKVSQNDYDADKSQMEQDYTSFRTEFDNFTITVQSGGGNNLIKNSVGYAGDKYWYVYMGELQPSQSTWILDGDAKHGIKLSGDVHFEQPLSLVHGETYTLRFKVKKGQAGFFKLTIDDLGATHLYEILEIPVGDDYDGIASYEFVYDAFASDPGISIVSLGAETEITDLMLAKGQNIGYWTQANGEVYTLKVRTDEDGVKVYRADGNGYTVMSPEEFAGYYNNQKIFTLNGDITEVMGLEIKGKGLWMRPVKLVQTSNSLDFVWTGV